MTIVNDRVKLEDVAREAGVSLATVDRVVNRRAGVRERTVARVEAAILKLSYRPDPAAARLARNRSFRFCFILPGGSNAFMDLLADQVRQTAEWLATQRAFIDTIHVDVFDPDVLASALETQGPRFDGVATIALDHPRVRDAIDELARSGVAVVTLVSDAPPPAGCIMSASTTPRQDGRRAPCMGRFLGQRQGKVGVIAGSLALRDHAERQFGFGQVMGSDFPHLRSSPSAKAVTTAPAPRRSPRLSSRKIPIWWAFTTSAPATAASPRRWRSQAAPRASSTSPTS